MAARQIAVRATGAQSMGCVMSGTPYPAADRNPPTLTSPNARDTHVALTFFVVLAALTLTLAGVVPVLSAKGCALDDRLVFLHSSGEASAVSRRGAPCLVTPLRSDWHVKALEVVTPPANGRITMRGATGLYYFPNSQFKGRDSFVFRVVRGIDAPAPNIENITMLVDVD